MSNFSRTMLRVVCCLLVASLLQAQRGTGDWMTGAFDAQRSNWVRNDGKISRESMGAPGFEFLWKLPFAKTPAQGVALTPPALLDFYISHRGFRSLAFVGASSNKVIGIDIDLARVEWEKSFPASTQSSSPLCPGGMTSNVARPTTIIYPPVPTGRGPGRGNPAKSGVGEPFEGAVTLKPRPAAPAAPPPAPAPAAAANVRRATAPPNPFAPRAQYVHAITSDGLFHSIYVSNGEEPNPALAFVPPNSFAQGLVVFDNNAYVSTTNSCGGDNGVYALNLQSKQVSRWKSKGTVAGTAGPAVSPDGTLYAAAGNELVALEETTLKLKGTYSIGAQEFTSSPVVFEFKGKDLVSAMSNDGRLHLLDGAAVAGSTPLAKSPVFSATNYAAGALASWQDPAGTRWVLAPAAGPDSTTVKNGAIAAWKVVEQEGKPVYQLGWFSRDLVSPLPPIIVNGVIFALSSGENRAADAKGAGALRGRMAAPAVLYALDALTGKELWNSGTTITSYVHSGGLSAGGNRVYVSTADGTQYAFGFPIEH